MVSAYEGGSDQMDGQGCLLRMFDNQPGASGKEVIDRDIVEQRFKFPDAGIRWVGKHNVVWTAPLAWSTQELFHGLRMNGHLMGHPTVRYIPTQELHCVRARFDRRDMRGSSTQCFDADGPCSRIEIQKATVRKTITKNREQRFPNSVGSRTERRPLRPAEAPASVGSCDDAHGQ